MIIEYAPLICCRCIKNLSSSNYIFVVDINGAYENKNVVAFHLEIGDSSMYTSEVKK